MYRTPYIICIDGSSKRQITKATLLVLYIPQTAALHNSPRGLRVHIRIGIAFVVAGLVGTLVGTVAFCAAASRLSMASGRAGRPRLLILSGVRHHGTFPHDRHAHFGIPDDKNIEYI